MNVRFFVAEKDAADPAWWFGGGMDLTPYYGFEEDAVHFHQTCQAALDPFGADVHPKFKKWCDTYFFLKHRQEPRGIGGFFFADLSEPDFDTCFALTRSVGDYFVDAYVRLPNAAGICLTAIANATSRLIGADVTSSSIWSTTAALFGLQSGGRTESILMSLPPMAAWRYDWKPEPGSAEAELYEKFLVARDWAQNPTATP
jgi:coproporphyrinogen III oxidase